MQRLHLEVEILMTLVQFLGLHRMPTVSVKKPRDINKSPSYSCMIQIKSAPTLS